MCKDSTWKAEISKNYLLGKWSRQFLTDNPQIISHHSKSIPDPQAFMDELDALIALHGSGETAWEIMQAEVNKAVRNFRILSGHHIPGPEPEDHWKAKMLGGTIAVPQSLVPELIN